MASQPFALTYAPLVKRHLKSIAAKYHSLIRKAIEEQLQTDPDTETQNRKPLKRPIFEATWEIRFGPQNRFRVLYGVDRRERHVHILAIGEKEGERLWIGGEEIKL
jgi:mRNA-degrading endonuclease RelE of RelBE toxin-antitoxin system